MIVSSATTVVLAITSVGLLSIYARIIAPVYPIHGRNVKQLTYSISFIAIDKIVKAERTCKAIYQWLKQKIHQMGT